MLEIDNKHYITPEEDSKIAMYDPFDVADEILVDILMIGRYIEKNDIQSSNDAIMKFVNKYGLLGELTYLPLNSNIVAQNKVYLPKDNLLSEKEVMKTYEYIELFLKCKKKQKIIISTNGEGEILEWNFNSLKLAIDTMFALNETSERKTVKMCKHCGKPFSSQNIKAEYCSPQCRNQANVYKSRGKV